jgi:hypothetical protein
MPSAAGRLPRPGAGEPNGAAAASIRQLPALAPTAAAGFAADGGAAKGQSPFAGRWARMNRLAAPFAGDLKHDLNGRLKQDLDGRKTGPACPSTKARSMNGDGDGTGWASEWE